MEQGHLGPGVLFTPPPRETRRTRARGVGTLQGALPRAPGPPAGILPTHRYWKLHSSRASGRLSAAVQIPWRFYKSDENSPHQYTHAHLYLKCSIKCAGIKDSPHPIYGSAGSGVPHLCRQTSGPLPSLGTADTAPSEGLWKCSSPEKGFTDSIT